jgi:starch synthase
LHVAFVWHMHQPYYLDDLTGTIALPWVRLRCAKDYVKMIDVLEEHPGIRQTFNLAPSLLDQIEKNLQGEPADVYLELTQRPAADLNEEERIFVVRFMAETSQLRRVRQYPRYLELATKKEQARGRSLADVARLFSESELRDLQMWFNLSWVDPRYLQTPALRDLVARGRDFAEGDKAVVLDLHRSLMAQVLPRYRAAAERGQVELITSAYYHPILPLLADATVALAAAPQIQLPPKPFAHPEDMVEQLRRGVDGFTRHFGFRPQGLWPPEAAISDAVAKAVAALGLAWMVGDEGVLARSLDAPLHRDGDGYVMRPETLYRPYRFEADGRGVQLLFRDAHLSNLIGFDYQNYAPDQAAHDLVGRLQAIRQRQDAAGPPLLVTIALDGENCWEFYDQNGNPFLQALYHRLEGEEGLIAGTVSGFLHDAGEAHPLRRIFPGSWIDASLTTWIGDLEHNRAWTQLEDTRRVVEAASDAPLRSAARTEVLIAEGSDWFWWFGRGHDSGIDTVWDNLFRLHLRNAYKCLEQPAPAELYQPIIREGGSPAGKRPDRKISPRLEAGVLDEAEWRAAGYIDVTALFGALHPPKGLVRRIWFGSDDRQLYLRFDMLPWASHPPPTLHVFLSGGAPEAPGGERWQPFVAPAAATDFGFQPNSVLTVELGSEEEATVRLCRLRAGTISPALFEHRTPTRPAVVIGLPFAQLGSEPGESLQMAAVVRDGERTLEVLPPTGSLKLRVPGDALGGRPRPAAPLKVLLVAAEVAPFAKVGGLADVAGALPKELKRLGHDVRVVMPRYATIDSQKYELQVLRREMPVPLAQQRLPADVLTGTLGAGVPIYFIENQQFYGREGMYGFWDDDARFIYFSRAVLEMCKLVDFQPDVIHVNDWHTAVIPNMLARVYADDPFFARTASVLTIHNLAFQGVFGYGTLHLAGLEQWGLIKPGVPALDDIVNLLGRGVYFADAVNTVSNRYAQEILTPEYGEKMDPLLRAFQHKLFGIINGIDYEVFNPLTDSHITAHFDAASLGQKVQNKLQLQRELGLPETATTPLIGLISRLYDQKGLDLISNIMWGLMRLPVQLVVLGAGEGRYEEMFQAAARDHPQQVSTTIGFKPALAQRIYAGSDVFLMPSRFEPCGLGQLISLRYGTIPVVRATGGLADTIHDWDPARQTGNGVVFEAYDHWDLFASVVRALETYRQPALWRRLQQNAMASDVSWTNSALQYVQLYLTAMENHQETRHYAAAGGAAW